MDNTFIPCELCDLLINFDQYTQHLEQCQASHSNLNPFEFTFSIPNNFINNLNNLTDLNDLNDLNDPNDHNDETGDSPEEISNSFNQFRLLMNNLLQHLPELDHANTYENLINLEDVVVPCKDIDKVAPLVPSNQLEYILIY